MQDRRKLALAAILGLGAALAVFVLLTSALEPASTAGSATTEPAVGAGPGDERGDGGPVAPEIPPRVIQRASLDEVLESVVCVTGKANGKETQFSGFLVDAEKGWLLTTTHGLIGAEAYRAEFRRGEQRDAEVLFQVDEFDLAVLEVEPVPGTAALDLSHRTGLPVGTAVNALGCPLGVRSASQGIVSSDPAPLPPHHTRPLIQVDVRIQKGSSGGPVVDRQGQVVGVVKGILKPTEDTPDGDGLPFAIPVADAKHVVGVLNMQECREPGADGRTPLELNRAGQQADDRATKRMIWEDCVSRSEHCAPCQFNLALLDEGDGLTDQAESRYRTIIETSPYVYAPLAQQNLVVLLALQGKLDDALAICDDALPLPVNAKNAALHYNCGRVHEKKGLGEGLPDGEGVKQLGNAVRLYEIAVEIAPEYCQARLGLMRLYHEPFADCAKLLDHAASGCIERVRDPSGLREHQAHVDACR